MRTAGLDCPEAHGFDKSPIYDLSAHLDVFLYT